MFFFFRQKTAYEMRISDWSSDVCSSDLPIDARCARRARLFGDAQDQRRGDAAAACRFGGEQVLQVTDVGDRGGAAVVEIMDEAEKLALRLGHERVDRRGGVRTDGRRVGKACVGTCRTGGASYQQKKNKNHK